MRMYDLILKKRNGEILSDNEIDFFVHGVTDGTIPDYQISAFMMAVYFMGLTDHETIKLTDAVAHSGDMIDLSGISGIKVDKHSTGGVGDKTTLIIAPMVAACGVPVAKMSGRGLGHTGGTVDKLEAIPGLQTSIEKDEFVEIVNKTGLCVIGQSGNLAPADKKLYALRDVTATVESVALIAASVMGKKIAAGSNAILLDVKTGSGAFMKTVEASVELAKKMVAIGEGMNRRTVALITDMDRPLGYAIGNSLEVAECVATLKGHGPDDLTEICIELAGNMLYLAEKGSIDECRTLAKDALYSGRAYEKLKQMVIAQHGDVSVIEDTENFAKAPYTYEVKAIKDGYISHIQTEKCGIASVVLGAGRETKESPIDFSAGIVFGAKLGDKLSKGDIIATLYTSKQDSIKDAEAMLLEAIELSDNKPTLAPIIHARVTENEVIIY